MDFNIVSDIRLFTSISFTPEMQDEMGRSMELIEAFNYKQAFPNLYDVVIDLNNDDLDATQHAFQDRLHETLDFLLEQHQVRLLPEASLEDKNEVLQAMYQIQNIEDPTPLLGILSGYQTDLEKLASIIEYLSSYSVIQLLDVLEFVAPSTMEGMKRFLENLEEEQEVEASLPEHLQPGSHFLETLESFLRYEFQDSLAVELIRSGVQIGHELKLYLPYVQKHLHHQEASQLAKNILSLLMMSPDTYRDPIRQYRVYTEALGVPPQLSVTVEVWMTDAINRFEQYRKAQHDAKRISVV